MKRTSRLGTCLLLVLLLVTGCGHARAGGKLALPVPAQSNAVGPGDVFVVNVVGEREIPTEFRVQPDGSVEFPYLDRLQVGGLEPQQIEELIKKGLIERKILVAPQVTLIVRQYNSKKVSIVGAVAKPGSLPWSEGMMLVEAISASGGFTALADGDHVRVTRIVGPARTVTATVSVDDITDGKRADVPLQAGDTIKVEQRIF